ncbi:MotE family protein [Tanticharoenia sakaeratensis]|uniref:Magnesium transporter MgtE intracellular domain-containing protein n=1 Tax=Tanticharoenia sakaeratensis NBRC 103193 TaxID=1231623 RepID=A0A0D6MHP1_9PROT|nr:hypothetical protein [Tanticharoenia sakaeratensis]GAN52980.1 hypothetical protein Tasa_004_045 [Tanticharoenia sakaeratensis NBRC 103193]GBQ19873.1 hypothetical protein AA103193_1180 [Tanticharoenia sakaeratensis NBRC 103193]
MPKLSLSRLLPVMIAVMVVVLSAKVYSLVQVLNGNDRDYGAHGIVNMAYAAGMAPQSLSATTSSVLSPSAPVQVPVDSAAASLNACDHDVACKGKPPEATATRDDGLINEVARRQHQLDAETTALDERKRAVEAAEAALQQRVTSLTTTEAVLRQSEQHDVALSEDDANRLVKIYQAMKPADAAAIFNVLDLRVSTHLLNLMDPRHASAIMGAMLPQRAILATQMLAKSHSLPPGLTGRTG